MRQVVSHLLLAIVVSTVTACAMLGPPPGVTNVDVTTAKSMLDRSALFVDLRGLEYKESHIPGSVHIDWNRFDQSELARVASLDQEIVLYCYGYGCYRSREASALAAGWGYENVYHFQGGYRSWKAKGYPLE